MHVDDFIDGHYLTETYARFVFALFRFPAALKIDFARYTEQFLLFCTYEGKRYRVTGASRLGDVWISADFSREIVDDRVELAACSAWSQSPEEATAELRRWQEGKKKA